MNDLKPSVAPNNTEVILIATGMRCPRPLFEVNKGIKALPSGSLLVVHADDMAFPPDIQAWCRRTGNELVSLDQEPHRFVARIRKV